MPTSSAPSGPRSSRPPGSSWTDRPFRADAGLFSYPVALQPVQVQYLDGAVFHLPPLFRFQHAQRLVGALSRYAGEIAGFFLRNGQPAASAGVKQRVESLGQAACEIGRAHVCTPVTHT